MSTESPRRYNTVEHDDDVFLKGVKKKECTETLPRNVVP
jgi:hypothetical protein